MMERKIVVKDFHGPDKHLYEDELGWQKEARMEARSNVSKVIWDMEMVKIGYNLTFYYVDNDTYYGIHNECTPIEVKLLKRDWDEPYIDWQLNGDTHDDAPVIATFEKAEDIWDGLKIDGKRLEEVIQRSYLMDFT